MSSPTILEQVLNVRSGHGFVVVASTTFQPTEPVTLKEILGLLDVHTIPDINTIQSSGVFQTDVGHAGVNFIQEFRTFQINMDLADQEHLSVMQTVEESNLATIDIVGPEKFGIVIGEGSLKHTFRKFGDVLLINNHAGKEIVKISGDILAPGQRKKHASFSQLIPEVRQLILAAAARNEVPREVVFEEYLRRINHRSSAFITDVHATAGFKLVCVSKAVLDDLLASGIVHKIQLNNGKGILFNRENDVLRIQSCAPQYSTRLSLEGLMNFTHLKSITLEVNTFLARNRHGLTKSLQAMTALQTIIITGEIFTDFGPADINELVNVNLNFNRILVAENGSVNEVRMMASWDRVDGKTFNDQIILVELENELKLKFQGDQAQIPRIRNFLLQLTSLFALVSVVPHLALRCTCVKVAVTF